MLNTDSPLGVLAQAVVAVALIFGAAALAYVDPSVRPQLAGAFMLGLGAVVGYFFNQRASSAGGAQVLNGMSHMAGLIAAGTPGPKGEPGAPGAGTGAQVIGTVMGEPGPEVMR